MAQPDKGGAAMLDRYAKSYQAIANALVPELPAGWSEARVLAEMRADNGMVTGFARVPNSAGPVWLDVPDSVYDAFREMYAAAVQSGDASQCWTSATMKLRSDGTFKMEYGYDPVPLDDQLDRVEEWSKRNLS
jgi:hypothetical protein